MVCVCVGNATGNEEPCNKRIRSVALAAVMARGQYLALSKD